MYLQITLTVASLICASGFDLLGQEGITETRNLKSHADEGQSADVLRRRTRYDYGVLKPNLDLSMLHARTAQNNLRGLRNKSIVPPISEKSYLRLAPIRRISSTSGKLGGTTNPENNLVISNPKVSNLKPEEIAFRSFDPTYLTSDISERREGSLAPNITTKLDKTKEQINSVPSVDNDTTSYNTTVSNRPDQPIRIVSGSDENDSHNIPTSSGLNRPISKVPRNPAVRNVSTSDVPGDKVILLSEETVSPVLNNSKIDGPSGISSPVPNDVGVPDPYTGPVPDRPMPDNVYGPDPYTGQVPDRPMPGGVGVSDPYTGQVPDRPMAGSVYGPGQPNDLDKSVQSGEGSPTPVGPGLPTGYDSKVYFPHIPVETNGWKNVHNNKNINNNILSISY